MKKLPKKLGKDPLIDAIFEVRFTSPMPAGSILPGILHATLKAQSVERLGIADMPSQIRDSDPNLRFAPIVRVHWEKYMLLIGDRVLGIACKIPYPGWTIFRDAILQVFEALKPFPFINSIERYSMKYVDLLPADSQKERIAFLNMDFIIGGHRVEQESLQAKVEIPSGEFLKSIQIVAPADVQLLEIGRRVGLIIDVDVICNIQSESMQLFGERLLGRLEVIHTVNKKTFFDCITASTIESLEPVYE